MLLQPTNALPEGPDWIYELKLDGYRALAIKTGGVVQLRSRNNKDFKRKYPAIAAALSSFPAKQSSTARWSRWTQSRQHFGFE